MEQKRLFSASYCAMAKDRSEAAWAGRLKADTHIVLSELFVQVPAGFAGPACTVGPTRARRRNLKELATALGACESPWQRRLSC